LVFNSTQTDNSQGVVPAELGATEVYVPQAVEATSFFQNLVYDAAFTPNGDGVNDRLSVSFAVVKTARPPEVRIYTLAGEELVELADQTPAAGRSSFTWDGRDRNGGLAAPGIYLMQLSLETDAKNQTVQKLVHVLY
jgi:flagellar hook assembly protein FlgD